jgi:hypothetical protein
VETMEGSDRPFTVSETHGILLRPEHRIIASSDRLGWKSLYASTQREAPYAATYAGVPDHLIILHLDGPVTVSRVLGKSSASRVIPPGGLFMLPGGVDFGVRLGGDLSTLHLYVRQAVVQEVAAGLSPTGSGSIELPSQARCQRSADRTACPGSARCAHGFRSERANLHRLSDSHHCGSPDSCAFHTIDAAPRAQGRRAHTHSTRSRRRLHGSKSR